MKKILHISADEMVATFLKAEIDSPRWKTILDSILLSNNLTSIIITQPDLENERENTVRKEILGLFRGYDRKLLLFEDFPKDVEWFNVSLTREELLRVKYMNYDYWVDLSQGTRLPEKAVQVIWEGKEIFGESNEQFILAAKKLQNGELFPKMIFVAEDENSEIVILEGHLRMTSYFLAQDFIPKEIEVIIGFSQNMKQWKSY